MELRNPAHPNFYRYAIISFMWMRPEYCFGWLRVILSDIFVLRKGKISKQGNLAQEFLTTPEWKATFQQVHNANTDCFILEGLLDYSKNEDERFNKEAVNAKNL